MGGEAAELARRAVLNLAVQHLLIAVQVDLARLGLGYGDVLVGVGVYNHEALADFHLRGVDALCCGQGVDRRSQAARLEAEFAACVGGGIERHQLVEVALLGIVVVIAARGQRGTGKDYGHSSRSEFFQLFLLRFFHFLCLGAADQ